MTKEKALEINKCKCGETAVIEDFEFDVEWYGISLFIVECPVCGRRSRPYRDEDEAICEWNGVEYKPYVEPPRERTEKEKEWDKRWAGLPIPMVSLLEGLAEKPQGERVYNWGTKLEDNNK